MGHRRSSEPQPFAGLLTWSHEVRSAVKRLDPTQSKIIQMIYFERRTQAQVAQELQLPGRTVARSVSTGLQALAVAMLTQGVE